MSYALVKNQGSNAMSNKRVVDAVNFLIEAPNYSSLLQEMTRIIEHWDTHPMYYGGHLSPLNAMRAILLALPFLFLGCAGTAQVAAPDQAAWDTRQARADSLLSLPPAQITPADMDWLQLHEAAVTRREQERREQQRAGTTSGVIGALVVSFVVIGGVLVAVIVNDNN